MIRPFALAILGIAGCKKKPPELPPPPAVEPASVDSRITVVSVSPSRVDPQKPVTARVFGSGFDRAVTVSFGEKPAQAITWQTENQLEVTVPPLEAGTWDVTVTNPDGSKDVLRAGLTVALRDQAGSACNFVVLYFETGSASLTRQAESTLGSLVPCYQGAPEPIRISGHADERGTTDYNLALSYRRALIVRDYLANAGLPMARLPVTTYGEEQPAVKGSGEEVWARNRRVELAID